ncbi:hypothetical protein N2152v2_000160 [Parachlorella kessleri]
MTIKKNGYTHFSHFRWMQGNLSAFTGLTSLHLTLHFNLAPSDVLHNHLGKLSATLQLLKADTSTTQMSPVKRPKLELLVPLPRLTRFCLARPFQEVALDFEHMPELQRLELRTFSALTGLRCLALRGKHSSKLLPMEPMPSVQALLLDDANIQELFYGPGKLYTRLRVLHLVGARSEDLMDCAMYPGLVQIEKMRDDSRARTMYGFAVRYAWIEAMLRPGLPGAAQCPICPLSMGSQLHLEQLERFRQYEKDYKEEVASPLALWHATRQAMQRLKAEAPVAASSLARVHMRLESYGLNVLAAIAAVEGQRTWCLAPPLQAASALVGQVNIAAQVLGMLWPECGLYGLNDSADVEWAAALTKADAHVKLLSVLAKQPVPGALLSERLVELGLKAFKPSQHGMLAGVAMQSAAALPRPAQQAAERAAAAVEGWKPAGASVRTASIEGWALATRALGL